MVRAVLNPQVPLFREARYLLSEETDIRDVAGYHAVLNAITAGHTTRGAIAGHIGRRSTLRAAAQGDHRITLVDVDRLYGD